MIGVSFSPQAPISCTFRNSVAEMTVIDGTTLKLKELSCRDVGHQASYTRQLFTLADNSREWLLRAGVRGATGEGGPQLPLERLPALAARLAGRAERVPRAARHLLR